MNLLTKNNRKPEQQEERPTVVPRYQIREDVGAFVVTAHVPGIDRTALETQVDNDHLTVVGRRTWTAPEGWTPVHQEISQGDYRLVLELDHRVNREAIRAELSQGVLTLTLPKSESLKPRRIEIQG
jgi:HSP20 family molecular chaperone IbpA